MQMATASEVQLDPEKQIDRLISRDAPSDTPHESPGLGKVDLCGQAHGEIRSLVIAGTSGAREIRTDEPRLGRLVSQRDPSEELLTERGVLGEIRADVPEELPLAIEFPA